MGNIFKSQSINACFRENEVTGRENFQKGVGYAFRADKKRANWCDVHVYPTTSRARLNSTKIKISLRLPEFENKI